MSGINSFNSSIYNDVSYKRIFMIGYFIDVYVFIGGAKFYDLFWSALMK
jgi:hypothetical protein